MKDDAKGTPDRKPSYKNINRDKLDITDTQSNVLFIRANTNQKIYKKIHTKLYSAAQYA